MPPAPETGTGVVGLKVRTEPLSAAVVAAAAASLEVKSVLTAAAEVARTSVLPAGGVTVTVKVRWVQVVEAKVSTMAAFVSVLAATVAAADSVVVVSAAAVVVVPLALLPLFPALPAAAPPKVKDWLGSAVLQLAMSMTLPLTVKQEPAWFSG